ncbi:MAG: hypothetical protein KA205_05560 [Acidobacteria bacterium]|nr:hypothetical protein [Acidobacteriota bacterium]
MTVHLGVMALCAACVAIVFAVLQRDEPGAQMTFAAKVFGALVGGALVVGLLQNLFFR